MKAVLVLSALLLGGCAARLLPAGVSGNETYVAVTNVWGPGDAMKYAVSHCAKYGRVPRLKQDNGTNEIFDCVKPSS